MQRPVLLDSPLSPIVLGLPSRTLFAMCSTLSWLPMNCLLPLEIPRAMSPFHPLSKMAYKPQLLNDS